MSRPVSSIIPLQAQDAAAVAKHAACPGRSTVGEIVVNGLSHVFGASVQAVRDADFCVNPGEFHVIVGPSGCGKTTILNVVAGLTPLQTGQVTISGKAPAPGRKDVAYMFAQDALLPWRNVLQNALFGIEIHQGKSALTKDVVERAREMLAAVGLSGFETAFPRQLSHGMRQRAALARTFLMDSSILLMDEPFGALDAHTKLVLQELVLRLWEEHKRTVLFITHDLAEAIMVADRVLICTARPGHIKASVPIDLPRPRNPRELNQSEHYHALFQRIWHSLLEEMTD